MLTITVDTLFDELDGSIVDGDISLRDAIAEADAGETIDFAPSLTSGGAATIYLSDLNQLVVDKDLTIVGPGAEFLTIQAFDSMSSGGQNSRAFLIYDGELSLSNVEISGLTLSGGYVTNGGLSVAPGGAVFNTERLVLNGMAIVSNTADQGGGIFNSQSPAHLTLVDSVVSGNTAISDGGGGIASFANASIEGSQIVDNHALGSGDGGGIFSFGSLSSTTISNSKVSGNTARDGGGVASTQNLTIDASHITDNQAYSVSNFYGNGGGIKVSLGPGIISRSTISGNQSSSQGGGIAGIRTVGGNLAEPVSISIDSSTISGNSTETGGGIVAGALTLDSSTVSGNTATFSGGGVAAFNSAIIRYSTITDNSAPSEFGGGGVASFAFPVEPVRIRSSIVAGNLDGDLRFIASEPDPFSSEGYNVVGTGNGAAGFNQMGDQSGVVDPMLGPLQENGGLTETHAAIAGSPVVDAGDPLAVAGVGNVPLVDQRGVPFGRIEDGGTNMMPRIDIGAFEIQSTVLACDFDGREGCDIDDIDALIMEIVAGTNNLEFDLNADEMVDHADRDQWLAEAGELNLNSGNPYLLADSNLDGVVDGQDFLVWNSFKFNPTGTWSQADWNADGITDGQDFLIWNSNKFQSSDGLLRSVLPPASPEPSHEIMPITDVQVSEPSTKQVLELSIIPYTTSKQIDAVFAGIHQREERGDAQRPEDIFGTIREDLKSCVL